ASDAASLRWRTDFIRTYLERDIPQLGPRIPAETLRRLWTMLAHQAGRDAQCRGTRPRTRRGRQDRRFLSRPAGGFAPGAAPVALARQCPQTAGQIAKGLCPRQWARARIARDRRSRGAAGAPGRRRKLGRIGDRVADWCRAERNRDVLLPVRG